MIKKSIVIFSFLMLLVLSLEVILKIKGFIPGDLKTEGVDIRANLKLVPNIFTNDKFGIYSINSRFMEELMASYDVCKRTLNLPFDSDNIEKMLYQAYCLQVELNLTDDTCKVCQENVQNYPFRDYLLSNCKSDENDYLLDYLAHPINKEGFRSIPFDAYEGTDKVKVLLIGDSYAWGLSSDPMFNSYADILLSKDYLVFNTGIPGTDPAQYAAIAKKYIPILKPDIVLVNFYEGNDFMFYERTPLKNEPLEYATNQGFILSAPYGVFLKFNDVVDYYKSITTIPFQEKNSFNKWCAKSRVCSSIIWPALIELCISKHQELLNYTDRLNLPVLLRAEITKNYINDLNNTAIAFGIPCAFVVIPEVPIVWNNEQIFENKGQNKEALDLVFEHTGYYFPEIFSNNDNSDHGHFNNRGSLKFAEYLDRVVHDKLKGQL